MDWMGCRHAARLQKLAWRLSVSLAARARRACAARSYLGCTLGLGMRVSVLDSVLELAAQITSPPQVPTP